MSNLVPFSNGRCEGANPSSHVIALLDLEFFEPLPWTSQFVFELGISVPNLETCFPGDRSHPYRKDRWRLHFIFGSPPSRSGKPLWQGGCWVYHESHGVRGMFKIQFITLNDWVNISLFLRNINLRTLWLMRNEVLNKIKVHLNI